MSVPQICKYCEHWDVEGKLNGGRGASGKCHCNKMWQDTPPQDSCSHWTMAYNRTDDQLNDLARKYDIY